MKTMTNSLLSILILFISSQALSNFTYEEITKDFKIGETYFVIMEGVNLNGIANRSGQFACASIVFTDTSNKDRMDYSFKAWLPEANSKCNFQDDSSINSLKDFASLHTCVSGLYKPSKVFDADEIKDTKDGNRAIELNSDDGHLFALSRCLGTITEPANILTQAPNVKNDYSRNPDLHTKILEMTYETRSFPVLEDSTQQVETWTIQLSNAWNYVILKDQELN